MMRSPSTPIKWAVVAGTTSPYLWELWGRVAQRPGHRVLFVHQERRQPSSFEHERTASWPPELEEIRYHSQVAASAVLPRVARFRAQILVCLGHTNLVPLGAAALARAARQSVTVYMGDTNGIELLKTSCSQVGVYAKLLLKREVLSRLFNHTLCLGWSNELAAETMRLKKAVELPLYTSDFALLGRRGPLPHEWHDLAHPILMCPARLVRQKNLEALVSAWRNVVESTDRGSLVLVGEGPLRASIERLGRDVPRSRFLMTGSIPRDSMGSAFGWADGVVLASVEEPWGMVVPEALGLGLPVLATDHVGAALSLRALAPGAVHVTRSDVASLDSGLRSFMSVLESAKHAAVAASHIIRNKYDMEAVAARLAGWGEEVGEEGGWWRATAMTAVGGGDATW